MTTKSTFEIDEKPLQILAPPDRSNRYEGISFSSSGYLLAIADAGVNTVFLFRRQTSGLFEDSPYCRIKGLDFPHDVSFAPSGNSETLAIAERRGVISIWEMNHADENYGSHSVFEIRGPQTQLNFTDGITFVPPNNDYLAASNLATSAITFYRRISFAPMRFRLQPDFVLKAPGIAGPDGIAFSAGGRWLAVANHADHSASVFERRDVPLGGALEYGPKPVTIIKDLGFRHPHSVAFSPQTNHLVVTNSGANHFSVFAPDQEAGGWNRWVHTQETFCPPQLFAEINGLHRMEGGPKGVAIHQDRLAVCSPEQGAKIYSFRERLSAADHLYATSKFTPWASGRSSP